MSSRRKNQQGGINIPGIILDELKERDYTNDERFTQGNNKRGSGSQLGRKERRKQQRLEKKNKRHHRDDAEAPTHAPVERKQQKQLSRSTSKPQTQKKDAAKSQKNTDLPFSSDDELSEGDFDEFDDDDLDEEEWEQLKDLEGDDEDEHDSEIEEDSIDDDEEDVDDNEEDDMSPEDVMAQLKKLKQDKKKIKKSSAKKEPELEEQEEDYPLPPSERMAMERDEMDMQYYAKKLKLKGNKKSISASDEFDAIGGLLEGLDFMNDYGADDEEYGDLALDDGRKARKSSGRNDDMPFGSDDELSEGDFDEFEEGDLDSDEWEQLKDLEDDGDESENGEYDSQDSDAQESRRTKKKENPYVAAVSAHTGDNNEEGGVYVPPSLRRKQLEESSSESPVVIEITKKVKSGLNRLSEANIAPIINSLLELFDKYPRQYVIEIITRQILAMVNQSNKLLDTYIMNFAAVAFAIFRAKGLEIGAYFIQTTVEVFLEQFDKQQMEFSDLETDDAAVLPKGSANILTLLAYSYDFGFISCRLLYDIIAVFVAKPNVLTTELLLRIVSVSGQLIRGDDPSTLKDIMSILLANVKEIRNPSPRLQFLLNTMTDLKNNRLKPSVLAADFHPLKKVVTSTFKAISSSAEPLQVSLDDIKNVDTKGKWWLVGASWRGNMNSAFEEGDTKTGNKIEVKEMVLIEDDLLDDIPDWTQLAKENRMNTDVRRAIFISIMSAQDYVDAFEKIEKLGLKNKQVLEIPRVLLSCLLADSKENGYNQYYALVASKLCEHHHALLKSFQFLFWNTIQKYEDKDDSDSEDEDDLDDSDEIVRLRRIANQGRFFGNLLGQNILKLDIFKHVPLITGLSTDGNLFVEVLLFQLFQTVAKSSEVTKKVGGKKTYSYKDEKLATLLSSALIGESKFTILKGLKWFLQNKFKYENYLGTDKISKAYKRDERRIKWAIDRFIDLINGIIDNNGDDDD